MKVCSLNEIDAYARKAARGAGMPWGLAEEAGKGTRWLAARQLPGPELLAALLRANDQRDYADMAPVSTQSPWRAREGALCPIAVGAALSDRITELVRGDVIRAECLAYPLLVVPSVGFGTAAPACFELRWAGVRVLAGAERLSIECDERSHLTSENCAEMTIAAADSDDGTGFVAAHEHAVEIDDGTWQLLDEFAFRTYVPESDISRQRGAGAGNIDND